MSEEIKELPKPTLVEDLGMIFATESSKRKVRYSIFKCGFCGTNFKAMTRNVVNSLTLSCGCYGRKLKLKAGDINRKHNLSRTRVYKIWSDIKSRTLNPKCKKYVDYGGRGIIICDEWKNDFMSFYTWAMSNGYEENKGLSIDRIDNDGNYEPSNCRWTTRTMQMRNQRIRKNNTSGYRGVSYDKSKSKFVSNISINRKPIHLGHFLTAVEGAIAYNNYIIENNLEGFILNEIPEDYLNQITKEEN